MSERHPPPPLDLNYASPGMQPPPRRIRWWWLIPFVALLLLGALILLPVFSSNRVEVPGAKCANNLRQIGLACLMYANDHGQQYPDSLAVVLRDEDITSGVFVCPSTNDTPANGATTEAVVANLTAGHHLSYVYVGKGLTNNAGADTVVAYEPLTNHGGAGMHVLYADGHVEFQDAVTAGKIVAELQSGHNPPRPAKIGAAPAAGK